jgi:putative transposase
VIREGAKFWLRVLTELKNRGVADLLIAVVDGLKGFPEAITAVFPEIQTCIVHLIRYSMEFASWKERKAIAAGLKAIYRAGTVEAAQSALEAFDASPWGRKYPAIAAALAAQLGASDPVLCLSPRGAPDHLHHQRDRKFALSGASVGACPRARTDRRSGHQADLAGVARDPTRLENAADRLACSQGAIRDLVWRSI